MAEYTATVYDPNGNRLTELNGFTNIDAVRTVNDVGAMTMTFPTDVWDQYIKLDGIIELYRKTQGYSFLMMDTGWLIRDWSFDVDAQGRETTTVIAYDLNDLIRRRIIGYHSSAADPALRVEGHAHNWPIGDAMKQAVRENFTGTATTDANRRWSQVSVMPNDGLGGSIDLHWSWRNCLDLFQELAERSTNGTAGHDGTYCAFEMAYVSQTSFEFRTYHGQRGINHSTSSGDVRLLDRTHGNLGACNVTYNYSEEYNYVLVGGKGEAAQRTYGTAYDATRVAVTPFNRIELWEEAIDAPDQAAVNERANMTLAANRLKIVFEGEIKETDGFQFGIHFSYGDLLTAVYRGRQFDVHVDSVSLNYNKGVERLDIKARCENYVD
jgi:hypothetical protein